MTASGEQNVVKLTDVTFKKEEKCKCYVINVFQKVFLNLYKTISQSISSNFADFFKLKSTQRKIGTQNELQEDFKCTQRTT